MAAADLHSTAVCRLFLDFPSQLDDERDGRLQDAHWFIGVYIWDWQDEKRVRANEAGLYYRPLPWYRQKAVCARVATAVRERANGEIRNTSDVYCLEDKGRLWDIMKASVEDEIEDEYTRYLQELRRKAADAASDLM